MIVFVNTNQELVSKKVEVEESDKVGSLIKKVLKKSSEQADDEEDNEVYLQDSDDDLDKGKSIKDSGITNGSFVFVGKCKTVDVEVIYMGRPFSIAVTPARTLRQLRSTVAAHFGLSEEEVADFQFIIGEEPLDNLKLMVGSFTKYRKCTVAFSFAAKLDING